MKTRTRLVLGSLLGAVAIHGAFMACSTLPNSHDAGGDITMLDAIGDAAQILLDAESTDAHAQDSGGACTCTPAVYDASFALTIDRGRGVETPNGAYSTAATSATAFPLGSGTAYSLWGYSNFFLADGSQAIVQCRVNTRVDRTVVTSDAPGFQPICYVSISEPNPDAGTPVTRSAQAAIPAGATVTVFDDTHIEFHVPSFTATQASAPAWHATIAGAVFRVTAPAATFLAIPNAYRP